MSDRHAVQGLLRQHEIEIDGVERLQRDDHRAGADILPEVDAANAQASGEGRAQGFLRDHRFLLRDLGICAFEIGDIRIDGRLACGVDLQLSLIAAKIDRLELRCSFQGFELRVVGVLAQLQERLTGGDILAGLEVDFFDDASSFEREVRSVDRAERSDRS